MHIQHPHRSIGLALGLALFGCDLAAPNDNSNEDAETGMFADDSSGLDDEGSPTPTDPSDRPPPDEPTNGPPSGDPAQILGALDGMAYFCHDPEGTGVALVFQANAVEIIGDGGSSTGTYSVDGDSITLAFADLGFTETSLQHSFALGYLAAFDLPSLKCYAVATSVDPGGPNPSVFRCPKIKYVPEVGWEENEFTLGPNGDVFRRQWTTLLQVPDELYWERSGFYVQDGDQVWMHFAQQDEALQDLSATITADGLSIDQLEPETGACQLQ